MDSSKTFAPAKTFLKKLKENKPHWSLSVRGFHISSSDIFNKVSLLGTIIPSYTQEVFLRFSLDECSIKFDSMTDRGLYWDLSDNNQSLKLQLFMGRLFDACKKEQAEYTDESEDDSDEETELFSIYVSNYFIF